MDAQLEDVQYPLISHTSHQAIRQMCPANFQNQVQMAINRITAKNGNPPAWDSVVQEEAIPVHDADAAPVYDTGFGGERAPPDWEDMKQAAFMVWLPITTMTQE